MRNRRRAALALALALAGVAAAGGARPASAEAAQRVVSINPSLTAILLALGAADVLVGVDDWSARHEPQVAHLPRVGGLFNSSLEAVAALRPDLVVLVPSAEQRDFRGRLEALGVTVLALSNITFEQVLVSIETLGERVGRGDAARERIRAIERARAAVSRATRGRAPQRTVLVLQREPLFVVGRGSFVDEMLAIAGGENLGRALAGPYPRASVEWLVDAAPEVLLDASDGGIASRAYWSRWSSLPAVASGRVLSVSSDLVTFPGPHLDRALRALAEALQGPGVRAELEGRP